MIANYHTHTFRCGHAIDTEREYVENAIARGLKIFGFSDHTPQYFPGDYYSTFRMRPELLKNYCDTIRNLSRKYADRIAIPLGLELEYYPGLLPRLMPEIRDLGVEYLLLGQHFVGDEVGEHYCGYETADVSILKRYCHQTADAMQTGMYTYFAHPDLLRFVGSESDFREQMRFLCREAKGCGMVLEINLMGKWIGRNYPDRRFWEIAAEEGCQAIIGWDAHAPAHLHMPQQEAAIAAMIQELGLDVVDNVELRKF